MCRSGVGIGQTALKERYPDDLLSGNGRRMLDKDIFAAQIYQSLVQSKFAGAPTDTGEYTRQVLKV